MITVPAVQVAHAAIAPRMPAAPARSVAGTRLIYRLSLARVANANRARRRLPVDVRHKPPVDDGPTKKGALAGAPVSL
jgi:hypothetical protein